jgi:type IV pilus assembly protein PilQ
MFKTIRTRMTDISFLLLTFSLFYVLFGCAQAPIEKADVIEENPAEVQSITITSEPADTKEIIEIISSKPVPYAAFKLVQPLRLIVGINAPPAEGLTRPSVISEGIIRDVSFETTQEEPIATRVIATLSRDVDYSVQEQDGVIKLMLFPKEPVEEEPAPIVAMKEEAIETKEPRVFFLPGKTTLNQVLGVDFFMLPKGRSRITVTSSKKAEYKLSPKNSLALTLEINNATIPRELSRYIDSSRFSGIVNQITPTVKAAERRVDLEISLKEMAPYHLSQEGKEIRIDFNKTSTAPPAKEITVSRFEKTLVRAEEVPPERVSPRPQPTKPTEVARMTLEFSNADIRNILKLIGEVSKKNIVWGPEVKGTVSMRLKDVPWRQALYWVLQPSNLSMIEEDTIIWVTTRDKKKQLEKEQEERQKELKAAEKAAKEEQKAAKEEEPLVTEYITVNYAEVEDIKTLIEENVKGPRGRISVDKANKTIILTDTAANIRKAKDLREKQDRPTKQVMIEARIVEASTSFTKDIGVGWGLDYEDSGSPWGGSGPGVITYDFATNFTLPTATTAGISFANTAGTQVLNAQLALSETEGKTNTISAPRIITRDTITATIKQGYKIVIPSGTDNSGNKTYEQVDASLKLEVTPKITPNDMVIMNINVSEDEPDWARAIGDNVPIKTKNANTEMMVASGDTVIIGGIYKETQGATEESMPWLSKIPILGWLFRRDYEKSDKVELLIFLTPTVLHSKEAATSIGG